MDKRGNANVLHTMNTPTKIFILCVLLFGFVTTFASGYFLANLESAEQWPPKPKVTGSLQPTPNIQTQDTTKFLPGKFYFDDTIIAITKDQPMKAFALSARRVEQTDNQYVQRTGLSYFDGETWQRVTDTTENTDSTIISNDIIRNWNVTIHPSRVLKEAITGEVQSNTTNIRFKTGTLQNEIGMRSLPGYTKFMSIGNGSVVINEEDHAAYFLHTKIFSLNANDIQFYDQPLGLKTDWIAFWTPDGAFYHVDSTSIDKPTPIYQTHTIGVFENADSSVVKIFNLMINRGQQHFPTDYTVIFPSPINTVMKFNRTNMLNKSPNSSYIWFMGTITGTVQRANGSRVKGIGIMEYIQD